MNATDPLTDDQARQWTLGRALSRSTWTRSWHVESTNGRRAVLFAPLGPADLGGSDALTAACRTGITETATRLRRGERGLPELLGTVSLESGVTGLLIPAAPSLQQRLDSGGTLVGAMSAVLRAAQRLEGQVHGAIHPTGLQIATTEDSEPDVRLGLPVPPAVVPHLPALEEHAGQRGWRPPEAGVHPEPQWDTWALCRVLWIAASAPPPSGDAARPRVEPPPPGPDKVALATLKDRAMARLAHEQTNPRFRARVAERLAGLLNRGLSAEHEPSPPYRFSQTGPLVERLSDVIALVSPSVTDVGRVMLGDGNVGTDGVFQSGTPVKVAVSVGCSHGTADHEDIVAGLRLVDQDAPGDGRVALGEAKFAVRNHPSGRLRFEFTLPDVAPGRYYVRCAFAVKDSGDEPKVAEGTFQVRPAPGYVPPAEEPGSVPIVISHHMEASVSLDDEEPTDLPAPPRDLSMPRSLPPGATFDDDKDDPTVHMSAATLRDALNLLDADDPSSEGGPFANAELIEGVFPTPIAPPEDRDPPPPPRPLSAPVHVEEPKDAVVRAFPGVAPPSDTAVAAASAAAAAAGPRVPPAPLAAVPTQPPTEPSSVGSDGASVHDDATVPRGGAFPDATGGMEAPSLGSAWMAAGAGEPDWVNGPADLSPMEAGDSLPVGDMATEDLPTWDGGAEGSDPLGRLKAMLFRDTTTAVGVATATSLLLVVLLVLTLKAC